MGEGGAQRAAMGGRGRTRPAVQAPSVSPSILVKRRDAEIAESRWRIIRDRLIESPRAPSSPRRAKRMESGGVGLGAEALSDRLVSLVSLVSFVVILAASPLLHASA